MKKLILVLMILLGSLINSQAQEYTQTKEDFVEVYSHLVKIQFPNSYVVNNSGNYISIYMSSKDFAAQGGVSVYNMEKSFKNPEIKEVLGESLRKSFKQGLNGSGPSIKALGIDKIYVYVLYINGSSDYLTVIYM
jgi:hypothetical protein